MNVAFRIKQYRECSRTGGVWSTNALIALLCDFNPGGQRFEVIAVVGLTRRRPSPQPERLEGHLLILVILVQLTRRVSTCRQ